MPIFSDILFSTNLCQPHAGEPHLPQRQPEVDEHHSEVGGEVGGQEVPLKRLVQEPDLGLRGADLQLDVASLVQSRALGLGRKHEADLARAVTRVQLEYLPAQSKLRMKTFR